MYLPARLALQSQGEIWAQVAQPEAAVPVHAGEPAGEVSYYYQDRLLFTLPLVYKYGLEPDPTPTPAPVLQVEQRPPASPGETSAPVQEIDADPGPTRTEPSTRLLWYVLLPFILLGGLFVFFLIRRRLSRRRTFF